VRLELTRVGRVRSGPGFGVGGNLGGPGGVCTGMTRYVLDDLRQAGAELGRRAAELGDWLDGVARETAVPGSGTAEECRVDLACYRALSAAALRLRAAAEALADCAWDIGEADSAAALRLGRGAR
jgi:hypothetical protein